MFNLIFLFVAKLLDTYLSALKNVLMIKNKHLLSALATTGEIGRASCRERV